MRGGSGRIELALQLVAGCLIGVLSFAAAVPREALFGGADGFAVHQDQWLEIASLRYFVWDEWRWPLTLASRMGAEPGTSLVFTDSIPIYALTLKVLRGAIRPEFNFLGVWLLLCYALLGAAVVAAMRMWGVHPWLPTLAAAALAVSGQALLQRFVHAALSFQAVLPLAVGLIGAGRWARPARVAGCAVALSWLTLAINVYLFVMVAVLAAALIGGLWDRGWPRRSALSACALLVAGAGLEAWALGFFLPHGHGLGFNYFSMNLLSPIFPPPGSLLGHLGPSPDATGGQYEGFNYLGIGLLLLLPSALWVTRSDWRRLARAHRWWAAAVATMSAVALSNRVWLGHYFLAWFPPIPDVISQFRAPGRFFWLVTYSLLVAAVVLVARAGKRWHLALVAAAVLQWIDAEGSRQAIARMLAGPHDRRLETSAWVPVIAAHRSVLLAPSWDCAGVGAERMRLTEFAYLASIPRTPISSVYSARPLAVDCAAQRRAFQAGSEMSPGTLVVVLDGTPVAGAATGWACAKFDGGQACSSIPGAFDRLAAGTS